MYKVCEHIEKRKMNVLRSHSKGLLLFTLLILDITASFSFLPAGIPGTISPLDPKLCLTQNVTFTCTLEDPPSNQSLEITFWGSTDVKLTENIIIFNSTVAQYTMYNVSFADDNDHIRCCVGDCKEDLSNMIHAPSTFLVHMKRSIQLIPGKMNPHDFVSACIGGNLTITCHVKKQQMCPIKIMLIVGNNTYLEETVKVDTNMYQFTLTNISEEHKSFFCMCDDDLIGTSQFPYMGSLTALSMPQEVVDMRCEVYNYASNMTCTWNYGMEYHNNIYPTTTCHYRLPELSASWTPCLGFSTQKDVLTAVWNDSMVYGAFSGKNLDFNITLKSKCGEVITSEFHQDTRKLIRPAPVYGLSAHMINSTCISLQWQTYHKEHNKTHRIRVNSTWADFQEIKFDASEKDGSSYVRKLVCDLHPYTDYTFDVQIIPAVGGYWSVVKTATGKTKDSAPTHDPELVAGGYKWDPKECTKPGDRRDICIYWKKLPEFDHNGEIQGYQLELRPQAGEIIQEYALKIHMSTCVRSIPCDVEYTIGIIAVGSGGNSPNTTSIKIIKAVPGEELQASFISEIGNSLDGRQSVELTWPELTASVQAQLDVRSFTVCWCVKDQGNCKKTIPINCSVVDGNKDKAVVQVDNPEDYIYGVSMETKYGNTGLQWQSCIYLKHAEPTKEPQRVSAETGGLDNTILVMWNKLTCESGQPYIAFYTLQYCPVNNKAHNCSNGDKKFVTVPAAAPRHVIVDLDKDQMYRVQVRGVTKDDKTSRWSEPTYATAINNDLVPAEIGGIAVGGFFILALAIAGGVCGFRYFRKRTKRYIAREGRIKMPKLNLEPPEPIHESEGYENLEMGTGDEGLTIISDGKLDEDQERKTSVESVTINSEKDFDKDNKEFKRQISKDSGVGDPTSPIDHGYVFAAPPPIHESRSELTPYNDNNVALVGFVFDNRPSVSRGGDYLHLDIHTKGFMDEKEKQKKMATVEKRDAEISDDYSKLAHAEKAEQISTESSYEPERRSNESDNQNRQMVNPDMPMDKPDRQSDNTDRQSKGDKDSTGLKQVVIEDQAENSADSGYPESQTTVSEKQYTSDYVRENGSQMRLSHRSSSASNQADDAFFDEDDDYKKVSEISLNTHIQLSSIPIPQDLNAETIPKMLPLSSVPQSTQISTVPCNSTIPSQNYVTSDISPFNQPSNTGSVPISSQNYVTSFPSVTADMSETAPKTLIPNVRPLISSSPTEVFQSVNRAGALMSIPKPVESDSDEDCTDRKSVSSAIPTNANIQLSNQFGSTNKANSGYVLDTVNKTPMATPANHGCPSVQASPGTGGYVTMTPQAAINQSSTNQAQSKAPSNNAGYVTAPAPNIKTVLVPKVQTAPAPNVQTMSVPNVQTVPAPNVQTAPAPNVQTAPVPNVQGTVNTGYVSVSQALLPNSSSANTPPLGKTNVENVDNQSSGYVTEEHMKSMTSDKHHMQDMLPSNNKGHGLNIGDGQIETNHSQLLHSDTEGYGQNIVDGQVIGSPSRSRQSSGGDSGLDSLEQHTDRSSVESDSSPASPESAVVTDGYISGEILKKLEHSKM